jgi:hypothetical protein
MRRAAGVWWSGARHQTTRHYGSSLGWEILGARQRFTSAQNEGIKIALSNDA